MAIYSIPRGLASFRPWGDYSPFYGQSVDWTYRVSYPHEGIDFGLG